MTKRKRNGALATTLAVTLMAGISAMGSACAVVDSGFRTEEFTVTADYGLYNKGKATMLLDGSKVFFSLDEHDIQTLVLGDVLEITYSGDMIVEEKYPQEITLSDGKIEGIKVTQAKVIEGEFDGSSIVFSGKNTLNKESLPPYVITDMGGSFKTLEEFSVGTIVYVSYAASAVKNGVVTASGLYAYEPR